MNGDEMMFPGGLRALDDSRTDVYLKEDGPGINEGAGIPMTFNLILVTGNANLTIVECRPEDLVSLADWIRAVAKDAIRTARGVSQP